MDKKFDRAAFTLVELLVVMALMALLASLAVMFVPRMNQQERAARGGTQLQQYLITAQSQALRDQAPRGVRFYLDANGNLHGIEMQYIMQPDDYVGTKLNIVNGTLATFTDPTFTNGSTNQDEWSVQTGDYLELYGGGLVHRITNIQESVGVPGQYDMTFASPLPFSAGTQTNDYRIIRRPRVSGDEVLKLPDDIIVDFTKKSAVDAALVANSFTDPNNAANTILESFDILFAPDGKVIGAQAGVEIITFWVRDIRQKLHEGEPTLITVYGRTGAIEAHPIDLSGFVEPATPTDLPFPAPADPYRFTTDGRSSGG